MSMIHIQTAGGDSLARAEKMLSGIPGGMEKAVRSAMVRSVSHLRTSSVKAVRERSDIAAERTKSRKSWVPPSPRCWAVRKWRNGLPGSRWKNSRTGLIMRSTPF